MSGRVETYHHPIAKRDDWETPPALFAECDAEFGFTLDACALPHNAKCPLFFTPLDNGLVQDWGSHVVWVNPPYGTRIGANPRSRLGHDPILGGNHDDTKVGTFAFWHKVLTARDVTDTADVLRAVYPSLP